METDATPATWFNAAKRKVRSFGASHPLTLATIALVVGFLLRGCVG